MTKFDLQDISLGVDMNKDNKILYHFYRYENGRRIEINPKRLDADEKLAVKRQFAILLHQVNKTWFDTLEA